MECLQPAVYVNYFDNSVAIIWRQENPVSFYVENDGETKFWEGGQCEVVEEGTFTFDAYEEGKGEGQEWGGITSNPNSPCQDSEAEEHDLQIALALDSEENPQMNDEEDPLAKCLTDLNSIPHVPRVNAEIPFFEALSDKQRLSERLTQRGLTERHMQGDGNCQFRALSDQLYRTPDHHMFVRGEVVAQLAKAHNSYSSYVPMEYNQYLERMARDGEWGDHVTLQAAADRYGVKISLVTSFKENCFIEIMPADQKSQRGLYLSFWSEIHYNSIYPIEECTNCKEEEKEKEKKKKKKWF